MPEQEINPTETSSEKQNSTSCTSCLLIGTVYNTNLNETHEFLRV